MALTVANLVISPVSGASLSREIVVTVSAADGAGTFSSVSATLGGIALGAFVLAGGVWQCPIDTRLFLSGTNQLVAGATHSTLGAVTQTVPVTVSNTLQAGTIYFVEQCAPGFTVVSVDVGAKYFALPAALNLRCWTQARLLSSSTPALPSMSALNFSDHTAMADLWALGQPVTLGPGQAVTGSSTIQSCQWMYAPSQLLNYAGDTVYLIFRLVPEEVQNYFATGFTNVLKIKRADTAGGATESYHVLAANLDGSGAGLYELTISGDIFSPVVTWVEKLVLTALCPDAIDFAVVGRQVYVVRASANPITVYDLDAGPVIHTIAINGETRPAAFIENCGGTPVLVCVDPAAGGNKTQAYNASFTLGATNWVPVWTLPGQVTEIRWAEGVNTLGVVVGESMYVSSGGTAAPSLRTALAVGGASITSLGTSALNASPGKSYVGLSTGDLYQFAGSGLAHLVELPSAVLACSAWASDGESLRGVAGYASNTLFQENPDGSWGAAVALVPPAGSVTSVTALQGFERDVAPATGTPGQTGYVPAQTEFALLVGTAPSGFLVYLQRSFLNPAQGAFESFALNAPYLVGYEN